MLNFNVQKRHVYFLPVYFEETDEFKTRPVIVLQVKDNQVFLVSTTASVPEVVSNFVPRIHSKRVPILNWRKNPFIKPSWVRADYIYTVNKTSLERELTLESFLGKMIVQDFNIVAKSVLNQRPIHRRFRREHN